MFSINCVFIVKLLCAISVQFLKLFIKFYIIELPQNGRERGDFKNASIRGRDAILSLNARRVGIGRVL